MAGKRVPEESLKGKVRTRLDSPTPTKAQLERKARSIARIKAMGLPTIDHLPVVEDERSIQPRSAQEVAARCLATELCAVKGETADQKLVDRLVSEFAAERHFSPQERDFIRDPRPSTRDRARFSWRYECVHVFLWALGYLPELNPPNRIADVASESGLIGYQGPEGLAKGARLRPMRELLDQADLYYRLHWAAIELRLEGAPSDKLNEEIVLERHRALNWLIRYLDQAWDDVSTDT